MWEEPRQDERTENRSGLQSEVEWRRSNREDGKNAEGGKASQVSANSRELNELCYYTLSHDGAEFIHQHVVDASGAQDASPNDKPIRLVFSLVGLYLSVERGFAGREVQRAHAKLGQRKQEWPVLSIPEHRGAISVATVMAAPISRRDSMIHEWCRSVWQAFSIHRDVIERLVNENGIMDEAG